MPAPRAPVLSTDELIAQMMDEAKQYEQGGYDPADIERYFTEKYGITPARVRATQEGDKGAYSTIAGQGILGGYGDELAGGLQGLGSWIQGKGYWPGYEKGRDAERQIVSDYALLHPTLSGAQTLGGNVLGAVAGGGFAKALGAPLLSGSHTVDTAAGAAGGAAQGYAESEGKTQSDRLWDAWEGAKTGAQAGLGIGYGVNKLRKPARLALQLLRGRP